MNELVEPLSWDTEFFGLKIGRITSARLTPEIVTQIKLICRKEKYG